MKKKLRKYYFSLRKNKYNLHSTGQFHKGGQQNGAFIVITGDAGSDIEIPNKDSHFRS